MRSRARDRTLGIKKVNRKKSIEILHFPSEILDLRSNFLSSNFSLYPARRSHFPRNNSSKCDRFKSCGNESSIVNFSKCLFSIPHLFLPKQTANIVIHNKFVQRIYTIFVAIPLVVHRRVCYPPKAQKYLRVRGCTLRERCRSAAAAAANSYVIV